MRNRAKFIERYKKSGTMTMCRTCNDFDICKRKNNTGNILIGTYKLKYGAMKVDVCDYWNKKGTNRLNEFKMKYKLQNELKVTCDNCIRKGTVQCRLTALSSTEVKYKIDWDIEDTEENQNEMKYGYTCNSWKGDIEIIEEQEKQRQQAKKGTP